MAYIDGKVLVKETVIWVVNLPVNIEWSTVTGSAKACTSDVLVVLIMHGSGPKY
jgi:hypothetical protein